MLVHEVVTTEKVPFTYRVAGIGSRFLAWLVDIGLIVLLLFAGSMVGSVFEMARGGLGEGVFLLWMFFLMWGYFILFEWLWHGQTPGKRLLGIRVVHWRGTRVSFFHVAVRNVLRVVDAWPTPLGFLLHGFGGYVAGFAAAGCNREQRRLGDLAAGTLVVHVERKAPLIQAFHEAAGQIERARETFVRQRFGQLERGQRQVLLDLCLRREQLGVRERSKLFKAVAEYFENRFGLAPNEFESDEKFVLQVASAVVSDHDLLRV